MTGPRVPTDEPATFAALSAPWQAAFGEAWAAYQSGSLPIGAAITDEAGVVVARGRNRLAEPRSVNGVIAGHDLAHAEINALLQLPFVARPRIHAFTLYTTVEPCPQCLGALVMSSLRGLQFAAPDPWAGCSSLLATHPYMRGKNVRLERPAKPLPQVCATLLLTALCEDGHTMNASSPFAACVEAAVPFAVTAARRLHKARTLQRLRAGAAGAADAWQGLLQAVQSAEPTAYM